MSKKESFIQFDREVITKLKDTTEAIVFGYIIHEQASSIRDRNSLRKITNKEIASKFGISEKQAGRVKTKLYKKNLLVKDSSIPNPKIGALVWDDYYKCFEQVTEKTGRTIWRITAIDETTHYFDYGFVKVDKEWFENPEINITTKYWVIFFKAFEPRKGWTPTWKGISKDGEKKLSCWSEGTIRDAYYRIRDEGWIHNDKEIDIQLDYQRIQGKSYRIDFNQIKVEKISDKEAKKLTKDVPLAEEQLEEMIEEKSKETQNIILETNNEEEELQEDFYDFIKNAQI